METWADTLQVPGPDRDALLETIFAKAYEDLIKANPGLDPLEELVDQLPWWIGATRVKVVNSDKPEDAEIQWGVAPAWILVGGNKLDRGFTVEGLTVTYMPRGAGVGNADSVQQRARFFGYKGSYATYCRAWLAKSTADALTSYVEHERVLRNELIDVSRQGITLKEWRRKMLLDPKLKPCRKAVVDLPYLHGKVRGDSWTTQARLVVDQVDLDLNRADVHAMLKQVGAEPTEDPRDTRAQGRNTVAAVPLRVVVELLTGWRTHPEDSIMINQLALLLGARLDDDPDLIADVFLMDNLDPRSRSLEGEASINQLFQGAGGGKSAYPGDAKFFTPARVSVQVHIVDVKDGSKVVRTQAPALAIRVPKELAGGVLLQKEDE
jgi:hypothetical protein